MGMDDIIAGVRTFQREVYPQNSDLFEQLAKGQSPDALVITCSDSRVDPFLLTQARPGQLFVLRNAGNLVPKYGGPVGGVTATIEFAVVALAVPNIIICGHSGCGAMAGLLNPGQLRGMPRVTKWLEHAEVVRESIAAAGPLDAADALDRAVEANVIVQLDHLRSHPSVADKLRSGQIKLHGWVYDIATGVVTSYNSARSQFAPLE
jgi:carbonic anhydrase